MNLRPRRPEATCGKSRCGDTRITAALLVSAANPCGVWISLARIAERPDDPPAAHVGAQRDRQPCGSASAGRAPAVIDTRVKLIVFWAASVPWASATVDAEMICPTIPPLTCDECAVELTGDVRVVRELLARGSGGRRGTNDPRSRRTRTVCETGWGRLAAGPAPSTWVSILVPLSDDVRQRRPGWLSGARP